MVEEIIKSFNDYYDSVIYAVLKQIVDEEPTSEDYAKLTITDVKPLILGKIKQEISYNNFKIGHIVIDFESKQITFSPLINE